jgi:hypothetical protein
MFWLKYALSAFQGMNDYDPLFGETFLMTVFIAGYFMKIF